MISNIFFLISAFFISFGILGILKYKNLQKKLLTSSLIDTIAFIFFMIAIIFKYGFCAISFKIIIILIFILTTNSVINHLLVRELQKKNGEIYD